MKKSLTKIICLLIIINLNWTGLLAIGQTFAYFSDTENSVGDIFQAGVLDMTLRSGQSNFVSGADSMEPGDQVNRDIYVGKTASSLALKHDVSFEFIDGDADLCDQLDLKISYDHYHGPPSEGYANRDMRLKYNDKLSALADYRDDDFEIPHLNDQFDIDPSEGTEQWFYYSIILPNDIADSFQGKVCNFKFVFDGWQTNLPDSSQGFTDTKKIESTIKVDYLGPQVVLNEFLPNAESYPEFIELYNKTAFPINLQGYKIETDNKLINIDPTTTEHFSGGNTTIPAQGWLVISAPISNPQGWDDILDNSSGTVTLYTPNNLEMDSYTYGDPNTNVNNTPGTTNSTSSGSVPIDKSYARIPDGSDNWVDPIPTPGQPNIVDKENVIFETTVPEFNEEIINNEALPVGGELESESIDTGTSTPEELVIIDDLFLASSPNFLDFELEEESTSTASTTEEIIVSEATSTEANTTDIEQEATTTEEIIVTETLTETSGQTTEDVVKDVVEEIFEEETVEEIPLVIEEPIIEEITDQIVDETIVDVVEEPEPEPEPEPEQIEEEPILLEPEIIINQE